MWGGDPILWGIVLEELDIPGYVWECPHPAVAKDRKGYSKCVFHLDPPEVPKGEDASQTLLDVLAANDGAPDTGAHRLKQFVGATFGTITIDGLPRSTEDDQPLYFIGASVINDLTVTGSISQSIDMTLATVSGSANFTDATFERDAIFRNINFQNRVGFDNVIFQRSAFFTDSKFAGPVYFLDTTFRGRVCFEGVTFDRDAVTENVQFTADQDPDTTSFNDGFPLASQ